MCCWTPFAARLVASGNRTEQLAMSNPLRSLVPVGAAIVILAGAAMLVALLVEPGSTTDYPPDSPEGTTQRYLQLLQDRDFDAAYEMLSESARDEVSIADFRAMHRWSYWEDYQQRIRLSDVEVDGDRARVTVTVERTYGTGIGTSRYSFTRTIPLVREADEWKIDDGYVDIARFQSERNVA